MPQRYVVIPIALESLPLWFNPCLLLNGRSELSGSCGWINLEIEGTMKLLHWLAAAVARMLVLFDVQSLEFVIQ